MLQPDNALEGARWNVVVVVDGKPAAQLPVNGNTVFINGFLLSYPVSSDVAVSVNVNGTVPGTAGPDLDIVQAVQFEMRARQFREAFSRYRSHWAYLLPRFLRRAL